MFRQGASASQGSFAGCFRGEIYCKGNAFWSVLTMPCDVEKSTIHARISDLQSYGFAVFDVGRERLCDINDGKFEGLSRGRLFRIRQSLVQVGLSCSTSFVLRRIGWI